MQTISLCCLRGSSLTIYNLFVSTTERAKQTLVNEININHTMGTAVSTLLFLSPWYRKNPLLQKQSIGWNAKGNGWEERRFCWKGDTTPSHPCHSSLCFSPWLFIFSSTGPPGQHSILSFVTCYIEPAPKTPRWISRWRANSCTEYLNIRGFRCYGDLFVSLKAMRRFG